MTTTPEQMRAALAEAVAHFNDVSSREAYFELYDPRVVFHGYPAGVEDLEGAKGFYAQARSANPEGELEVIDTAARDDLLEARFRYAGNQGVTVLRFGQDGKVVERWQGATLADV